MHQAPTMRAVSIMVTIPSTRGGRWSLMVDETAFLPDVAAAQGIVASPPAVDSAGMRATISRSDRVLRFVRSRQRFVRRCHEWKKAPATAEAERIDVKVSALSA